MNPAVAAPAPFGRIAQMRTSTPGEAVHTEIASATCERDPVCALVVAVYAAQAW